MAQSGTPRKLPPVMLLGMRVNGWLNAVSRATADSARAAHELGLARELAATVLGDERARAADHELAAAVRSRAADPGTVRAALLAWAATWTEAEQPAGADARPWWNRGGMA